MMNETAPLAVSSFGGRYLIHDGGETPDLQEVIYQFAGGLVTWTTREANQGSPFQISVHGTKGTLRLDRGGFTVELDGAKGAPGESVLAKQFEPMEKEHVKRFLDAIRSRKTPAANIDEGHRTAVMCHLGNLSMRLGRSLEWDADREQIKTGQVDSRNLLKPYRAPWRLS